VVSDSNKTRSASQPKAFEENVLPTFTGKRLSSDPLTREAVPPLQSSLSVLAELASGVDALYLSGRAVIPDDLFEKLELARTVAADKYVEQGRSIRWITGSYGLIHWTAKYDPTVGRLVYGRGVDAFLQMFTSDGACGLDCSEPVAVVVAAHFLFRFELPWQCQHS
jgi:hypothetical protein